MGSGDFTLQDTGKPTFHTKEYFWVMFKAFASSHTLKDTQRHKKQLEHITEAGFLFAKAKL